MDRVVCFISEDKDPRFENDAGLAMGHVIGMNYIASLCLCLTTAGQGERLKLESTPLQVNRVIVRLAPEMTESNIRYASELLDAMNYAASMDSRLSVLPRPAVDAVAQEIESKSLQEKQYRIIAGEAIPRVREFRLAQKLLVDWIVEVKFWPPEPDWKRATHVEVGLRSAQWGPILANGFGKIDLASTSFDAGSFDDLRLLEACRQALTDLWGELLPIARVLNTFEERATLTPILHRSLVRGLEGLIVRGREATNVIYLHSAQDNAPEIRVIRMRGPMPGDKVVFLNVRKAPGGAPTLSRHYSDRLAHHRW